MDAVWMARQREQRTCMVMVTSCYPLDSMQRGNSDGGYNSHRRATLANLDDQGSAVRKKTIWEKITVAEKRVENLAG